MNNREELEKRTNNLVNILKNNTFYFNNEHLEHRDLLNTLDPKTTS